MKNITRLIIVAVLTLLPLVSALAVEKSADSIVSGDDKGANAMTGSQTAHNASFLGGANTSMTTVNSTLTNVETCNAQAKLWNGTACVAPATGSNVISTTAIMTETFYTYGTVTNVNQTGSSSCCEWYFTVWCTCTAAQQTPAGKNTAACCWLNRTTVLGAGLGKMPFTWAKATPTRGVLPPLLAPPRTVTRYRK